MLYPLSNWPGHHYFSGETKAHGHAVSCLWCSHSWAAGAAATGPEAQLWAALLLGPEQELPFGLASFCQMGLTTRPTGGV